MRLLDLYAMTEGAIAAGNGVYLSAAQRKKLNELIATIDREVSLDYPALRGILVPRRATERYQWGTKEVVLPPERWEEPLVQYFLRNYKRLMGQTDKIFCHSDLSQDPVYANIENREVREKIERREMDEKKYMKLKRVVEKKPSHKQPPAPVESAALAVRPDQALAVRTEARLNAMSDEHLAAEAGFARETVRNHRARGVDAQGIVEEKALMMRSGTSAALVHRVRESGRVGSGEHDEFIEFSRNTEIPGTVLIGYMKKLGVEFADLVPIMVAVEEAVQYRAEIDRVSKRTVWNKAIDIYCENPDTDHVIEALMSEVSGPESIEDGADREEAAGRRFQRVVKSANLGPRYA